MTSYPYLEPDMWAQRFDAALSKSDNERILDEMTKWIMERYLANYIDYIWYGGNDESMWAQKFDMAMMLADMDGK